MLKLLQSKNPELEIFSVFDQRFSSFGRVIKMDTEEIVKAGKEFRMSEGVTYMPSTPEFEKLKTSEKIRDELFGTLPAQTGFCYGHNRKLNGAEWHTSSEINIAVTDLVLILGHLWDIKDGKIDSSAFKGVYVPENTAIEVYATTLHYCPCQVKDDGFMCVVALPEGTNTALEKKTEDKKLVAKNKWLIAHVENEAKIKQGVPAGITGINYEIKY